MLLSGVSGFLSLFLYQDQLVYMIRIVWTNVILLSGFYCIYKYTFIYKYKYKDSSKRKVLTIAIYFFYKGISKTVNGIVLSMKNTFRITYKVFTLVVCLHFYYQLERIFYQFSI